jgi:hypothetical protein
LVTTSEYEPDFRLDNTVTTRVLFVNDAKESIIFSSLTVGAAPVGIKVLPEMVSRLVDVLTTVLYMAGVVAARAGMAARIRHVALKRLGKAKTLLN